MYHFMDIYLHLFQNKGFLMRKNTFFLLVVFVLLTLFAADVFALDTITVPGGGSSSEITSHLNSKTNQLKLIFGVIIGCLGMGSAAIGALQYTLKRWEKGHAWLAGGAVGLLVGSLITAYASFWAQ